MECLQNIKAKLVDVLKFTEAGNRMFYQVKQLMGRNPVPDLDYPELISIEVSSICNMSCTHCPPHMKEFRNRRRAHSNIEYDLFNNIMDDIDKHGTRCIALHKDGEPLIHPRITEILKRVKKNVSHKVYLTTNGQNLNTELINTILEEKIDVVNFSIGAFSEEFYSKIKGAGFKKVIGNIKKFISAVSNSDWKPKIVVQIVNHSEYSEMKKEIKEFKKYWKNYDVQVSIWKKLTWGVLDGDEEFRYRYPCYSLWHSLNINSNGLVTACCMDWQQELVIGNAANQKIEEIWKGEKLDDLRRQNINGDEWRLDACSNCNYWKWQPMLLEYPLVSD